ncbi:hypothetical protein AB1Y20_009088 [Prymnesium parvum]|uniref:Knr4/Smi1-like domain-containing protein n=1 Tax=Prymnesium parvum TaxID=97485 RepID=A0AB34K3I0_PRYPA
MLPLFEELARSVIDFLDAHPSISRVHFSETKPATQADITLWEENHPPVQLPDDLKSFFYLTDGLELCWDLWQNSSHLPLGSMHINSLSELQPVPEDVFFNDLGTLDEDLPPALTASGLRAFDLDNTCDSGRVCIFLGKGQPQVWFQDNSCSWSFIASSFTDFFRLVVLNLGLPRWQHAYTEAGLDPAAKQWFKLLAPARLNTIDARGPSVISSGLDGRRVGGISPVARSPSPSPIDPLHRLHALSASCAQRFARQQGGFSPVRKPDPVLSCGSRPNSQCSQKTGSSSPTPSQPQAAEAKRKLKTTKLARSRRLPNDE